MRDPLTIAFAAGAVLVAAAARADAPLLPLSCDATACRTDRPLQAASAVLTGMGTTPYFFAGENQLSTLTIKVPGANRSLPETPAYFEIHGTEGGETKNNYAYKAALIARAIVTDGSGGGLGANIVCDAGNLRHFRTEGCTGAEIDLDTGDADRAGSVYTTANTAIGLLVNGAGLNTNSTAIEIAAGTQKFPLFDAGIRFDQPPSERAAGISAIRTFTIEDDADSHYAWNDTGNHDFGFQLSGSIGTTAFGSPGHRVDGHGNVISPTFTAGNVSAGQGPGLGDFNDATTNGTGYYDTGRHTNAVTLAGGYTNGLVLAGHFADKAIVFPQNGGFVDGSGHISAAGLTAGDVVSRTIFSGRLTTPASSHAPCHPGDFEDDENFHYVCVAKDRWKRVALSGF